MAATLVEEKESTRLLRAAETALGLNSSVESTDDDDDYDDETDMEDAQGNERESQSKSRQRLPSLAERLGDDRDVSRWLAEVEEADTLAELLLGKLAALRGEAGGAAALAAAEAAAAEAASAAAAKAEAEAVAAAAAAAAAAEEKAGGGWFSGLGSLLGGEKEKKAETARGNAERAQGQRRSAEAQGQGGATGAGRAQGAALGQRPGVGGAGAGAGNAGKAERFTRRDVAWLMEGSLAAGNVALSYSLLNACKTSALALNAGAPGQARARVWPAVGVRLYAAMVRGLAALLRVADAVALVGEVQRRGVPEGDREVSFGVTVDCPTCRKAFSVVQPQQGRQVVGCAGCKYEYELVSGDLISCDSESLIGWAQRLSGCTVLGGSPLPVLVRVNCGAQDSFVSLCLPSLHPITSDSAPILDKVLRLVRIKRGDPPAAVHSVVLKAPLFFPCLPSLHLSMHSQPPPTSDSAPILDKVIRFVRIKRGDPPVAVHSVVLKAPDGTSQIITFATRLYPDTRQDKVLRFVRMKRGDPPVAVHSVVLKAPDGTSQINTFATVTPSVPAQSGERITIACAAPSFSSSLASSLSSSLPSSSSASRKSSASKRKIAGVFPAPANRTPGWNPSEPMALTNHVTRQTLALLRAPPKATRDSGSLSLPPWVLPLGGALVAANVVGAAAVSMGIMEPNAITDGTMGSVVGWVAAGGAATGGAYNFLLLPKLRELPGSVVDGMAVRQQLLEQHAALRQRLEALSAAASEEVRMLARMCQLQNKMQSIGQPSTYSARWERVVAARKGLDQRLLARINLVDSYAKVLSLIEMDADVPMAQAAGTRRGMLDQSNFHSFLLQPGLDGVLSMIEIEVEMDADVPTAEAAGAAPWYCALCLRAGEHSGPDRAADGGGELAEGEAQRRTNCWQAVWGVGDAGT
ncbi:unnamed protein product [Closterium sp. NIES-64]|nr:unnamed protein product [Closterium sp. NIES-64]